MALDPIQLEVLWNRLLSVANEQQTTLVRTAFSTIVRESLDLACGVFDTRGWMIGQSLTGTPGHINPMATGAIHFLEAYPPESLEPGDVLVTNDPWQTAGQVNDFTVLTPVFRDSKIVAYFANCCHAPDIGGRILSAEAREVFEEGLRVPITKLFHRGKPNRELLKIIRANVRTPDETVGDLYAQTSSNAVGARSLLQMMDEFHLETIDPLADEIIERSEGALRKALQGVPNGRYLHEVASDGFEEPVLLKVAVTVEEGDIHIDFAGSSPQSPRGINVVLNYTKGYASFAVKAAISPEVPHNEGSFRPVHIRAPEGSILNCSEPAAVASRHLVGHLIPGLIFGALAQAIPERVIAGGADAAWMSIWRATWPQTRQPANFTLFQLGGTGARPNKDGLNTTGFPSGVAGVPAEVMETQAPILQLKRALRTDSGGPGKFRGGLGQATDFAHLGHDTWSVSGMVDRTKYAAPGLQGGLPGQLGEFRLNDEKAAPKTILWMEPGAVISMDPPGGGGYGEPQQRDPLLVLQDVINGYVSIESSRKIYGVAINYLGSPSQRVRLPGHYEIDFEATAKLRASAD
ncbi:MAG: hydantoinase B/oxoprolinase family protein [Deltaproteobacteria bacterium]|nr:hydantoinase B/oxoprolinase family protein [Deltaproteobacteria bacterium]